MQSIVPLLLSFLTLGINLHSSAQGDKYGARTCIGELIPLPEDIKTIGQVTKYLAKDPIIREYHHLHLLTEIDASVEFVPLTDSAIYVLAGSRLDAQKACASFNISDYIRSWQLYSLLDQAIENGRTKKTPLTDLYWLTHFPIKPDNKTEANFSGTSLMTLDYSSIGLNVTFTNGILTAYIRT